MLIPLPELINKYNLNIKGVIQVGAHFCEEHNIYVELGLENIIYIEPCKEAFCKMVEKIIPFPTRDIYEEIDIGYYYESESGIKTIRLIKAACGDSNDKAFMYVSNDNQGQSNSLLKPQLHLNQHPEVVFTDSEEVRVIPLDEFVFKKDGYNLLVMDVQGAEGLVLKGATETLKHIDCIYTEVNRDYTYEGNMLIEEMDLFLEPFGFVRVETFWPSPNWSWGDSCFIRKSLLQ